MRWLTLLLGLALHGLFALRPGGVVQTGRLPDTDAYARTLRILRLHETGAWHDSVLPALNAPEGLSLHWTRLLDVLVLLPARAAMLAGVPARDAIFWAGAAASPLLHIAAALAAAWAAGALWPGRGRWLAAGAILLNPLLLLAYGAFGQTDHHMAVLLAILLALGAALHGRAVGAGVALGVGLWVSPEVLLAAGPMLAALGLVWCWNTPDAARQGARLSLALLATLALALAIERPPAEWLDGDYDRLSAQHLLIAALAGGGFFTMTALPLASRPARFALAGGVAALAAAVLLALYPGALRASQATADAATAALFLPFVAEMRPLGLASPRDLVLHAGGLLSLLLLPLALRRPGGVMLALVALAAAAATLQHRRFGADLAAATALLAPGFLHLLPRRPIGVALAAALAALPPYAGLFLPAGDTPPRDPPGCDWPAMADHLATLPPATIFTDGWRPTPELAWRTRHRFVVAPYHRAGQAFQDTADVLRATDDARARAILARRGATLLLLCVPQRHAMLGPPDPASLDQRLRSDAPPGWLAPLPLPAGLAAFRLLRVE